MICDGVLFDYCFVYLFIKYIWHLKLWTFSTQRYTEMFEKKKEKRIGKLIQLKLMRSFIESSRQSTYQFNGDFIGSYFSYFQEFKISKTRFLIYPAAAFIHINKPYIRDTKIKKKWKFIVHVQWPWIGLYIQIYIYIRIYWMSITPMKVLTLVCSIL